MKKVFFGRDGIRSGWSLLIFSAILLGLAIVLNKLVVRLPHLGDKYAALLQGQFNPIGMLLEEAPKVVSLLIALWLMTRIERRRIGDYGWRPLVPGAARRCAVGFVFGVFLVAAMYGLQWAEHVYSFGNWAIPPGQALAGGLLWFAGCFLVGIFEGRRLGRAPLDVDREAIRRDRTRGLSLAQLAKVYGVSRTSVRRILSQSAVPQGCVHPLSQTAENTRPQSAA